MDGISLGGGSGLQSFSAFNRAQQQEKSSSNTTTNNTINSAISTVSQTKDYTQAGTTQNGTDPTTQNEMLANMGIGTQLNVEV